MKTQISIVQNLFKIRTNNVAFKGDFAVIGNNFTVGGFLEIFVNIGYSELFLKVIFKLFNAVVNVLIIVQTSVACGIKIVPFFLFISIAINQFIDFKDIFPLLSFN